MTVSMVPVDCLFVQEKNGSQQMCVADCRDILSGDSISSPRCPMLFISVVRTPLWSIWNTSAARYLDLRWIAAKGLVWQHHSTAFLPKNNFTWIISVQYHLFWKIWINMSLLLYKWPIFLSVNHSSWICLPQTAEKIRFFGLRLERHSPDAYNSKCHLMKFFAHHTADPQMDACVLGFLFWMMVSCF